MDVEAFRLSNGYVAAKVGVTGELVAVAPQLFGKFRLVIGDEWGIRDGY